MNNYEYKLNDKIEFTFGDSDHTEGWMITTVYFNEYRIDSKYRVCCGCRDCQHSCTEDYNIYNEPKCFHNWNYNGYLSYSEL